MDGVTVTRLKSIPVRKYGYFITPSLPIKILAAGSDLIYASGFGYWPVLAAILSGKLMRKRIILQPNFGVSDAPFHKAYMRHLGPILRKTDAMVFYSEYERRLMESEGPVTDRNIVAYPGVDETFFDDRPTRGVLEKFGLGGKKVVLSVGRMDEGKQLDVLVRCAPLVVEKVPDAAFLLTGPDFGERQRLENMAESSGIGEKVVFAGTLSDEDLNSLYREANILAHPSGFELFGMVIAEAFASGLPVVAAEAGSIPELVEHDRTGMLVKSGSHEEMADALIRMMTDEKLRGPIIAKAREKALNKYQWEASVDSIEKLCVEVAR